MRIVWIAACTLWLTCGVAIAGYSIFVREQVTPATILVHGSVGMESRFNPGPVPTYPATYTKLICRSAGFSIYSSSPSKRAEVWANSAGTATDAQVLAACSLRADITEQIKSLRATALERAAKNAGILAVYSENYAAATALLAGTGDSTIMKDGQTAAAYLAGFGARLGMTPGQFASYIVLENRRVGPAAYQIEDEYLRLAYGVIPTETSVAKLLAYPAEYRRFCGL